MQQFVMTDESITEETIKAYEDDCKILRSERSELTKFIDQLIQKDKTIGEISGVIKRIESKAPPAKPNVFNLQDQYGWSSYFDAAREHIQNQNELDALKTKLADLEKERKEIEERIRPLVPQRLYGVKITNGVRSLTVNDESIIGTDF